MAILSVEQQDRKLRAECPDFRLVLNGGWIGIWEGPLRPICQTYRIRIVYFSRTLFDGWWLANPYVSVTVVDPPIGPDPRGTGEPPQHVYRLGYPPAFPRLCIYDPAQNEWQPHEYIVDKIIPWTIKWLLFHEIWVATGEWKGGGRHPEVPAPCLREGDSKPENHVRREQILNAAFHSLGQRIGAFVSSPLMEAASAGSFLPPSWLDWSADTLQEIRSRIISTLLLEHQRAASSPLVLVPVSLPANYSISTSGAGVRFSLHSPTMLSAA